MLNKCVVAGLPRGSMYIQLYVYFIIDDYHVTCNCKKTWDVNGFVLRMRIIILQSCGHIFQFFVPFFVLFNSSTHFGLHSTNRVAHGRFTLRTIKTWTDAIIFHAWTTLVRDCMAICIEVKSQLLLPALCHLCRRVSTMCPTICNNPVSRIVAAGYAICHY